MFRRGETIAVLTALGLLFSGYASSSGAEVSSSDGLADNRIAAAENRTPIDWSGVIVGYRTFDDTLHLMNVDGVTAATIMLRGISPAHNEIVFSDGYIVRIVYRHLKPGKLSEYAESYVIVDPQGNIVAGGMINGAALNYRAPEPRGKGLK